MRMGAWFAPSMLLAASMLFAASCRRSAVAELRIFLAADPIRRGGVGNCLCERFGEAAIAPVVHVQSVRREECLERDSLVLLPIAHECEAMKHVDLLLRRGARD